MNVYLNFFTNKLIAQKLMRCMALWNEQWIVLSCQTVLWWFNLPSHHLEWYFAEYKSSNLWSHVCSLLRLTWSLRAKSMSSSNCQDPQVKVKIKYIYTYICTHIHTNINRYVYILILGVSKSWNCHCVFN